jgi:murein DD-endopeptidase MepM/ murein hydrolase activator NlpD
MSLGLRACLFVSAAASLAACASNPALEPVAIDYRGDAPGAPARQTRQPVILADATRVAPIIPVPATPPAANAAPKNYEPDGYQRVVDLGPSSGVPAVAEAQGLAAQSGSRPGGARRMAADNPAARAIEVQPKDTLYDISRRYAVNMRALIETNGLEPPYRLSAGDTVFLPPPNVHVVQAGETLYSVSRRYNVDTRSLALLNSMARPWTIWPGDELLLPPLARDQARSPTPVAVAAPPAVKTVVAAPKVATPKAPPPKAATPDPVGPISIAGAAAVPKAEPRPAAVLPPPPPPPPPAARPSPAPVLSTPAGSAGREFIWPVAGNVLKGFGPATDGQRNDGVNISAIKGSHVLASAGGEVVYAGSELAGFGNLVLIRHPGGWVTAYAHADTVLVQEGDLVKQGQAIATVGSTGNAGSPQVHFELRKGKEPVDPSAHLPPLQG